MKPFRLVIGSSASLVARGIRMNRGDGYTDIPTFSLTVMVQQKSYTRVHLLYNLA